MFVAATFQISALEKSLRVDTTSFLLLQAQTGQLPKYSNPEEARILHLLEVRKTPQAPTNLTLYQIE
jgi:hypothetical protein